MKIYLIDGLNPVIRIRKNSNGTVLVQDVNDIKARLNGQFLIANSRLYLPRNRDRSYKTYDTKRKPRTTVAR